MRILAINCGSRTVKWTAYRASGADLAAVGGGTVDATQDHGAALRAILRSLPEAPEAVVHRVVHGGARLRETVLLTPDVEAEIRRVARLAPLHNAPALAGIEAAGALGVPMVAVFDTAFHRTMPERARRYALPDEVGPDIERYGFHGISHAYVAERYATLASSPSPTLITLHLGGGCSAAAVRRGESIDTSMGFSPLEGLVMATRSGDIDPMVVLRLLRDGRSLDDVETLLHHHAGLRGLAGDADMRALLARGDAAARAAVEIFVYRVRKTVGAYLAVLEGEAEAVVVTGGIGENAPEVRRRCLEGFAWAGLRLDAARNEAGRGRVSTDGSTLHAWVIPTDEAARMAREAIACLEGTL